VSSTFEVLPAIDLRGGRVVRLTGGDFDRERRYGEDPAAVAVGFVGAGARWLHVVDLDGARAGVPQQAASVAAVLAAVSGAAACEVAGGLRTSEAVSEALAAGAARIVVGTAALRDPGWVGSLIASHGADRIVAALDIRDGMAVGEGWRSGVPGPPADQALAALAEIGVERFEVTAIERDGSLAGPDLALLDRLVGAGHGDIVASGGIRSLEDLSAVRSVGAVGAIVGTALYEGRIDLGEAIRALR
jgi:phosphoribosylformimino-5-aminoimidazole carboxamide ribotide isomerase